ncbi:unnamed protein product [Cylindrotheca closterium]|uniref:Transmembrane protein n=1 Tax=Cylindrotheca closterium TaxID=2856 RepID=A0AAD2G265_9STRA|nr:unnamed protein product [Cylindrotheca closterium]
MQKQRPTSSGTLGLAADEEEEESEDEDQSTSHSRIEKVIMDDDLDLSIASAKREDVTSLVNLLYFLSVFSLGVTGFFLVVNLIPSCDNFNFQGSSTPIFTWKANLDTIPTSAQEWAMGLPDLEKAGSFAYVRSTGITIFQGSHNDAYAEDTVKSSSRYSSSSIYQDISSPSSLWTVTNSSAPELVQEGFYLPGPMVAVTDDAVCFPAVRSLGSEDASYSRPQRKEQTVYCSNGIDFKQETFRDINEGESPTTHLSTLTAFYPIDGILWFKELDSGRISGTKIYSLDPTTMISALHSYKVQQLPSQSVDAIASCDEGQYNRIRAIVSLLVSILPMAALTFFLGKETKVPSMGISAYIIISLVYACLHILVSPNEGEYMPSTFRAWFAISGLTCLLLSTYLLLALQQHDSNTPRWVDKSHEKQYRSLLGISAVAFAWGTLVVLAADLYDQAADALGWWLLFNILVCCPLLLFGAAGDSTFVLALGGLGFLADAIRLSSLIDSPLFFFIIFSLMGLMVGLLGYYFAVQFQPIIQKWAQEHVAKINDKYCKTASDLYGLDETDYGDDDISPLAPSADDSALCGLGPPPIFAKQRKEADNLSCLVPP